MAIAITQLPILENLWLYSFDDGTYSHAFLIPFISMYLYWLLFKSGELVFNQSIQKITLFAAIITAYMLWVSINAQFPTGYRISFILFITAVTTVIFKPSIKLVFPALFLFFLVPIWGAATTILQSISTYAATYLMSISGIPIFVEGNTISIPSGIFEIAGGCSGLRYLIVSLAISSLFTFLNIRKYSHALTFLFVAVVGALITNWLRITALIMIGHFTEMQSDLMQDHNSFGWYIYMPFMIWLFYFGQRFVAPIGGEKLKPSATKVNISSTFTAMLLITLISAPLRNLFIAPAANHNDCNVILSTLPVPQLIAPATSCIVASNNETLLKVDYVYSGKNIDGSVDNYLNSFTPFGWKIDKAYSGNESNVLLISRNSQKFKVIYSFSSNGKMTNNLTTLKKSKLVNSLFGSNETRLIWQAIPL